MDDDHRQIRRERVHSCCQRDQPRDHLIRGRRTFERSGVNGKRMSTQGFGSQVPAASNATAAGRSRNRRVVAVLTRMYQEAATSRRTTP